MPPQVAQFSIHPLFEDPLSDQIPLERAHEIWARSARPPWLQQQTVLVQTVDGRLGALETVTRRLNEDLYAELNYAAPRIRIGPPDRAQRVNSDGQLWYAFSKLNEAPTELEVHQVMSVSVAALLREHLLVAVDLNNRWSANVPQLVAHGLVDLDRDLVLDPVHTDFFTRKLLAALQAIGNPNIARRDPLVARAPGQGNARGARAAAVTPASEVLWAAAALAAAAATPRDLVATRAALTVTGSRLNVSPWQAWEAAMSRRLRLIWGPPGTGKSHTLRALLTGAVVDARTRGQPLRALVRASTYKAMDNLLLRLPVGIGAALPGRAPAPVYRLRSYAQPADPGVPPTVDVAVNRHNPSPALLALRARLEHGRDVMVVGATPEQVHNLLTTQDNHAVQRFFDLIVIDEASQMDVPHEVLALCGTADGGAIVLAGDPLQLPPIHKAEAPLGPDGMVGSVYRFFRDVHGVPEEMLEENYRSNATIVEFARDAGYRNTLTSYSPQLRLNLLTPVQATPQPPANWPAGLFWTQQWAALLDPARPAVCRVQ